MSQKHELVAGFDPGGKKKFGWCVARIKPWKVIKAGCANHAAHALACAMECLTDGDIVAAGIDAPLYWARNGASRKADNHVREQMKVAGATKPEGTVQAANSLRGACLIQGFFLAKLIERAHPNCLITETHPKALLAVCKHNSLARINQQYENIDKRDAVISAWAAARAHQGDGQDLFKRDANSAIHTFLKKTCYWWPKA